MIAHGSSQNPPHCLILSSAWVQWQTPQGCSKSTAARSSFVSASFSSLLHKREATDETVRPIRSEICGSVHPLAVLQYHDLAHQGQEGRRVLRPGGAALRCARPGAGRGLVGGQPGGKAGGGAVEVGLERSLQGDVPLVALVVLRSSGTPYLTAWANSGKSGRASREQALRTGQARHHRLGQTGGMRRQRRLGGSSPGHANAIEAKDYTGKGVCFPQTPHLAQAKCPARASRIVRSRSVGRE